MGKNHGADLEDSLEVAADPKCRDQVVSGRYYFPDPDLLALVPCELPCKIQGASTLLTYKVLNSLGSWQLSECPSQTLLVSSVPLRLCCYKWSPQERSRELQLGTRTLWFLLDPLLLLTSF